MVGRESGREGQREREREEDKEGGSKERREGEGGKDGAHVRISNADV